MKTKKKPAVLLTCIVAIGLMAGCGASNTNQSASNNDSQSTSTNQSGNEEADTNSENTTDTTENTSTGNGKTLVVYYSASGNTKDVAEKIAKITEADSRVSREHDDESLRDVELVSTTVDNWDSYDTVYIGYPIWWGIAAWPVDNFVKENDFTGKTVIPFCTAASSGIGDSGNLLEEMTGTGDWKEGERFHGGASESDISSWIDSLGL